MCGRYNLITDGQALAEFFGLLQRFDPPRRYNIAPTQLAPVVRLVDGSPQAAMLRWGLIPGWSKTPQSHYQMINARAETVAEKPAYRAAFRHRRCLVPATGFFEWSRQGARKQPYNIQWHGGELMAFAGLWEHWRGDGEAQPIDSFSIIVTDANDAIRPLHERMPVILAPADFQQWLAPGSVDTEKLQALLKPAPSAAISSYPVGLTVNNPGNDDPCCVAPSGSGSEPLRSPPAE
ncbi:MAG: SOS response-associated peptidase [Gammaproteobacteria bacterium]|nr:SOS response-associated peptidase [Gammaproteobacteria bacterium]